MGLRNSAPAQELTRTQAANQSDQGDFNSAFSSLMEGDESESVEETSSQESAESQEPPKIDPIEEIEANTRAAREKWKLQKELKDLKAEMEKLKTNGSKAVNVDSDNPLKELGKLKGWSKDDIVNKALEALEDDGMTEEEAKKEVKSLSYEEIVQKVKDDLKKERAQEEEENGKRSATEKAINTFKEGIKKFATDNAEKYPLIEGLGGVDGVYKTIEDDYMKKEEEFGVEWAQKNMMTVEQASKKVNEILASSVKNALKSEHVKKFILSAIKEDSSKETKDTQSEDFFQLEDEPQTLTNSVHKRITDPKDSRELTENERFEQAFAYLE